MIQTQVYSWVTDFEYLSFSHRSAKCRALGSIRAQDRRVLEISEVLSVSTHHLV